MDRRCRPHRGDVEAGTSREGTRSDAIGVCDRRSDRRPRRTAGAAKLRLARGFSSRRSACASGVLDSIQRAGTKSLERTPAGLHGAAAAPAPALRQSPAHGTAGNDDEYLRPIRIRGLFTWIPAYLSLPPAQGGRGLSLVKTTTFFLVLCAGKFVGYAVFGFLADAWGRRKPYFTYLLIAAVLVPIYGMTSRPTLLLLLGPLVAFFGTGFFSGYAAIASEIFPGEIRAAGMGLSYNVGRGISAFAVGALAVKHGIGPALFLQAGAFFVAAVLSLMLPETRGSRFT